MTEITIYIGIDDTDIPGSRGTGRLAHDVAIAVSEKYRAYAITRHQLFVDDRIPYTSHNSNAVVHVDASGPEVCSEIFEISKQVMLDQFLEGSDPGLAVGDSDQIRPPLIVMAQDAKTTVLDQELPRALAKNLGIRLEGLGGTEDGVIGAMAGLGLAATKDDGRFLLLGSLRTIMKETDVETLLANGVDSVYLPDGRQVTSGIIRLGGGENKKKKDNRYPKPSAVAGKTVLFVKEIEDGIYQAYMRR
ncbi:ABC transporter substrate-binding protein [Methanolacinia paynteri]|uniref:ABC transporter substrate-binding protein n=1 Tax=Methanolacinia paynteri TaxID=230356 RepID=UPI000B08DFBB|nr:ABC transporter substrate-binding protein [Methanolacinia paynteri]